jgi:hypothetical protein
MWLGTAKGLVLTVPEGETEPVARLQAVEVAVGEASGRHSVVLVGGEEAGAVGAINRAVEWFFLYWKTLPGVRADPHMCEIYVSLPDRPCQHSRDGSGLEAAVVVALVQAFTGATQEEDKGKVVWGGFDFSQFFPPSPAECAVLLPPLHALVASAGLQRLVVPLDLAGPLTPVLTPEEQEAVAAKERAAAEVEDQLAAAFGIRPTVKPKQEGLRVVGVSSVYELLTGYLGPQLEVSQARALRHAVSGARLLRVPVHADDPVEAEEEVSNNRHMPWM